MTITVDRQTEERIQHQLDSGAFSEPSEIIARALDLLEAEDWLMRNKQRINLDLDESFAQAERGEGYSLEEAMALLEGRHAAK